MDGSAINWDRKDTEVEGDQGKVWLWFLVTESELTEEHPSDNINYEVRKWDLKEAGLGDMPQEG